MKDDLEEGSSKGRLSRMPSRNKVMTSFEVRLPIPALLFVTD